MAVIKNELVEASHQFEGIQISAEKVLEWQEKYGEIFMIEVPKDESYEDFFRAILRKPNEAILNEYLRKMDSYPVDANMMLIKTVFLAGDEEVYSEDYATSATTGFVDSFIGKEAKASKLNESNLPDYIKKDKFSEWCKKYKATYLIEIPVDDTFENFISCVIKHPVRQLINKYITKASRVPIAASRELLKGVWLAGDEEIKTDMKHIISASGKLGDIVIGGQTSLKKISVPSKA